MEVYLRHEPQGPRKTVLLGDRIAGGGAGDIYLRSDCATEVAKIYRAPEDRQGYLPKIEAMLAARPRIPSVDLDGKTFHQLAWPTSLVETKSGQFLGFCMPKIDFGNSVSLETMLQKRMRARLDLPEFYGYRITAARNLAASVAELHAQGHYIIDLKPMNVRLFRANMLVAIVDCDGFSIHSDRKRYAASQFTPEYIAPEAKAKLPGELGIEQDLFALSVAIFRLLNNGLHPFQASQANGTERLTLQDRVWAGHYAYSLSGSTTCFPSKLSIHTSFPEEIRTAFDQAFLKTNRPPAAKWRDLLHQYADPSTGRLIRCEVEPQSHAHFGGACGWCNLEERLRVSTVQSVPAAPGVLLSELSPFRSPRWVLLAIVSVGVAFWLSNAALTHHEPETVPVLNDEHHFSSAAVRTDDSKPLPERRVHPESPTTTSPEGGEPNNVPNINSGQQSTSPRPRAEGFKSLEADRPRLSSRDDNRSQRKSGDEFYVTLMPTKREGFVIRDADIYRLPRPQSDISLKLTRGARISIISQVNGSNWYLVEARASNGEEKRGFVLGDQIGLFVDPNKHFESKGQKASDEPFDTNSSEYHQTEHER